MKIKLVSGKEVNTGDIVYWVNKDEDLRISRCDVTDSFKTGNHFKISEDDTVSEAFATREEAEEWRNTYIHKHNKSERFSQQVLPVRGTYKVEFEDREIKYSTITDPHAKEDGIKGFSYVIKPTYYKGKSGQQLKDVFNDFELTNYNINSAIAYLFRAGKKDEVIQELNKAVQFITYEKERLSKDKT